LLVVAEKLRRAIKPIKNESKIIFWAEQENRCKAKRRRRKPVALDVRNIGKGILLQARYFPKRHRWAKAK